MCIVHRRIHVVYIYTCMYIHCTYISTYIRYNTHIDIYMYIYTCIHRHLPFKSWMRAMKTTR